MGRSQKRDEMALFSYLVLALRDSFYYKSRLIGSILGALIAVSFIAGAIISVDGISSNFFQDRLEKMDYHISIYRYDYRLENMGNIDVDTYAEVVSNISKVDEVRGYVASSFFMNNITLGFNADLLGMNADAAMYKFGETIDLPEKSGEVIIPTECASQTGLKIGDVFQMQVILGGWEGSPYEPSTEAVKINFTVFDIRNMIDDENSYRDYYDYGYQKYFRMVLSIAGFERSIEPLSKYTSYGIQYKQYINQYMEVKIDPSFLKNLDDAQQTRNDIRRLVREIDTSLSQSDYSVENQRIEDEYYNYQFMSWFMRIFFVILSVPLLLISFYLLSAGSKVGMDERIREIGLLKIKGASTGQVIVILFLESLIYGVIGGGLGLIAGTFLSSFFTAQISGLEPFRDILRGDIPLPGIPLLILAFVLVPLVILIMRIRAILMLSKVPLLEALGRATIIDKQKNYKLTRDLMILSFTLLIVGSMLYFNSNTPTNFYTRMIYFLLIFFSPITVLFLPFLLILTISRILILGFDFTLNFLSNIGKLIIADLYPVVKANMQFQRKRIATMTILVTAVIAFGILISTLDASREEKVVRDVSSSIPTDLAVLSDGASSSQFSNISTLNNVEGSVEIDVIYGLNMQASDGGYLDGRVVSFDSERYLKIVDVPKDALKDGKGVRSLKSGTEIPLLINSAFNYRNGLTTDDTVSIRIGSRQYDAKIIGTVSFLPGTRSTFDDKLSDYYSSYLFDELYEEPALYVDSSYIPAEMTPDYRTFLIDLNGPEEDFIRSMEGLRWNGTSHIVFSKDHEVGKIKDDQYFRSIQMLLDMEYLFVIVAVTGGVTLFMTVSTASRRREFAELIARGATRKHVLRLILTEGAIVLAAALIIGTGIGIFIAYAFQHLFSFDLFQFLPMISDPEMSRTEIDTGAGIVFPPTMFLLHIFASIAVLGASLLTSYLASKVDVASSLRLRTS
jgi:ABC-type lipoprotein release transport system permease subunit